MDSPASYVNSIRLLACALLAFAANAVPASTSRWRLVENADFEIYSQGDIAHARAILTWLEQLRTLFAAAGVRSSAGSRVRVIGFESMTEYESYRLRPSADAYYIGTESRDYIVMPSLEASKFSIAAHEYAHQVIHSGGLRLPAWLNEGLAEFFSTIRISDRGCELGGDIRNHSQTLRGRSWMPLSRLLATGTESFRNREESQLFYAQSWALTEMLLAAPEYQARFPALIASLISGTESSAAFAQVYGKSLDAIARDLHDRLNSGAPVPVALPSLPTGAIQSFSTELTPFAARLMLAELLLAGGELDRAEALYRDLARESPNSAAVSAALGTIALRQGNVPAAQLNWKRAMDQGIMDAGLCYRYAVVADNAGVAANEIRPALLRAIALKPDFDDARFKLALLESNASHYESAIEQLLAMRSIAPVRAFGYWSAMAFAQDQLGHHEDSRISAQKALEFASTAQERTHANELAYVAATELTVQFTRDENGNSRVTTTRVPRGTPRWNPFIEPLDRIRTAAGQLRSVDCLNDKVVGISVDTAAGSLKLAIPDPLHVLMRGATEFTCGPQSATAVTVEFAATANHSQGDGILRGMEIQAQRAPP